MSKFKALILKKRPKEPESEEPDPPPFPYLDLPAELRNKVMMHLLFPAGGVVPPPGLNLSTSATFVPMTRRQRVISSLPLAHGPQWNLCFEVLPEPQTSLFLTNRQLYAETVGLFYANNVFYLPNGTFADSTRFYNYMNITNRAHIRHIALRFTIHDLTPSLLQAAEASCLAPHLRPLIAGIGYFPPTPHEWAAHTITMFRKMWVRKFVYVCGWLRYDAWNRNSRSDAKAMTPMSCKLEFLPDKEMWFREADNLVERREGGVRWKTAKADLKRDVDRMVLVAGDRLGTYVETMVGRLGWEKFKKVHKKVGKGELVTEREFAL